LSIANATVNNDINELSERTASEGMPVHSTQPIREWKNCWPVVWSRYLLIARKKLRRFYRRSSAW